MRRLFFILAAVAALSGGSLPPAAAAAAATAPSSATLSRVREAIAVAVRDRMGDDADVTVSQLQVTGDSPFEHVQAVPEPDARLGETIVFRLLGSNGRGTAPRPAGSASGVVTVSVEHVRARALIVRGRELASGDVERVDGQVDGVTLRRLPRLEEVQGARVLVNLAPGEIVAKTAVTARPAVKSGQVVRAIARIDGLEVTASLVAAQDGAPGAVIRVVNKESRRELRARVLEAGVVEVIP